MNYQPNTDSSVNETVKTSRASRKLRFGTIAAVTTVVVVAIIMLLNVVMDIVEERYPLTVDLTAENLFTLDEDSVALAKGIAVPVEIVVFAEEGYFSAPNTGSDVTDKILTQFYEALKQYQSLSGGKVSYHFVDLDANPTLATKYEAYAVSNGSILFLCGERYQTCHINDLYSYEANYTTYTYDYSSEVESVMAAKINLVSASVVKNVVFLTGHSEVTDVITNLKTLLNNNGCDVSELDIAASAEPPEEVDAFVIAGASTDYTADEIAKLRGWLDNGGKRERDLVVLINPLSRLPNLQEMLADEYGIEVLDQLVCETDANNVYNMDQYNAYANVVETDFTAGMTDQRVLAPLSRPLKVTITSSTDESTYAKTLYTFGETAKVQDLAEALNAVNENETTIETKEAAEYPIVAAAFTTDRIYDNPDQRYYTTDVIVYGTVMFANANTMDITSACNEELFLSVFRGLTGLESVITVSDKPLSGETLDFGGSKVPTVLGLYVFTIGLPLLLIGMAIVVFLRRRRL